MDTPRREFIQLLAAGAAAPLLVPPAMAAAPNRDSRLMGVAKFVDVDGIRTRYFDGGAGEALVLVHGGQ